MGSETPVSAPVIEVPSSSPQDGSTPSPPGSTAAEPSQPTTDAPSTLPELTPEQRRQIVNEYVKAASDDELHREVPAWRGRLGTAIEQAQKRLKKEADDQQARQAQYAQSDAFFRQYETDPAAFGQLMIAHPEYAAPYQEVQKWRMTGGVPPVDAAAVAAKIVTDVEALLRPDPRFAHMTTEHWDGLRAVPRADEWILRLVEAGIAEERKKLNAAHKTELDAREKAWQAKYAGGAEEPGTVPGTPTGGNGTYTLEQINKMSRVEREALPAGVEKAALNAAMGIR